MVAECDVEHELVLVAQRLAADVAAVRSVERVAAHVEAVHDAVRKDDRAAGATPPRLSRLLLLLLVL